MSIASSASEDGWVPTVYDSVEKVKGTAENKRTVCCVVPYDASTRSVLMISSQKKPGMWTLPKGGKEEGEPYAEAALREAWEEGGILGYITSECICQIDTERNHVYFYPLQVSEMKTEWPESGRSREWVSVEEAIARVYWRPEQAEALQQFSTWRDTLVESDTSNESSESGLPTSGADEWILRPGRLLAQLSNSSYASAPPAARARSRSFAVSAASPSAASDLPRSGDAPSNPTAPATVLFDAPSQDPAASSSAGSSMVSSSSSGLGDVRQPVRLSVPESSGGRRLGTSARDGGTFKAAAAGRRSYNEKRRLKSLEKYRSPTAPTSTELGQLIAQGPQVWHKVLSGDALTIPQVVEYLADPLLHGAPVPPIVGAEITPWYEFVRRLNKHLKPGNPTLELPADVRSTLLHNGVTRILQHQPSTDPFLLLLLLDLCLATDAQSSVELFRTIAGRVHDARASWWIGDEPQPKHLAEVQRPQETFTLVDRNRLALTREGIVDAWDQSVLLSPPLLHRRRLFNRLSGHNSKDRLASTPEGQRAIGGVDYTMNFVTSSAVQQPTDPIVLILILKSYLSTYPSESGQAHFRATLDIVPQLALSWTPVYKHSIRESIKTCIQADTEMYHAVRSWFRNELRPYLGDMTALWHGILPSPREVGFGLVSHEARSEARSLAYKHGKNLYDPGEALDFNRLRPRNPDAIPLWREGEAAPPKRISRYEVDGSFGLRQ